MQKERILDMLSSLKGDIGFAVQELAESKPSGQSSFEAAVRSAVSAADGKTIGFFSMGTSAPQNDSEPVVGWLVCVKGKHFGESFQLAAGRNAVGCPEEDVSQDARGVPDEKDGNNPHERPREVLCLGLLGQCKRKRDDERKPDNRKD